VYSDEPPLQSESPLLNSPNTVLVPHIGYATCEALDKRAQIVFENVKKWLQGDPQNVQS